MLWQLLQQCLPARPRFVACFFVTFANGGIGWFTGTHETVSGAFVNHWLVFLAGSLHQLFRFGNTGVYPLIIFAIETVDRTRNVRDLLRRVRWSSVKRISRFQFWIFIRVRKGPSSAPTESTDSKRAVAGRNFERVIGGRVENHFDLILRYRRDRFARSIGIFKLLAVKKIRRNRDHSVFGQLIAHAAQPIG